MSAAQDIDDPAVSSRSSGGSERPRRRAWHRLVEAGVTLLFAVVAIGYARGASYREDYVVLICTYALLALGMYVPYIMSGGLSLAYNAYLGIGAYASALVGEHLSVSTLWGLPVGFVLSAAVATVLGMVTGKLSGFYLAGVTLLFGVAFQTFLIDNTELTAGLAVWASSRRRSSAGLWTVLASSSSPC